jgi:hypothetical protein
MRTLLVDDDSWTFNLLHPIAAVNGEEPVAARDDEPPAEDA